MYSCARKASFTGEGLKDLSMCQPSKECGPLYSVTVYSSFYFLLEAKICRLNFRGTSFLSKVVDF